jgi:hypothetical protein
MFSAWFDGRKSIIERRESEVGEVEMYKEFLIYELHETRLATFSDICRLAEDVDEDAPAGNDDDALADCSASDIRAERLLFELIKINMVRADSVPHVRRPEHGNSECRGLQDGNFLCRFAPVVANPQLSNVQQAILVALLPANLLSVRTNSEATGSSPHRGLCRQRMEHGRTRRQVVGVRRQRRNEQDSGVRCMASNHLDDWCTSKYWLECVARRRRPQKYGRALHCRPELAARHLANDYIRTTLPRSSSI